MIGKTIGPYHIVDKLGEGGMGKVYRARDTRLKRDVALKILPESVATDPDRLARFQREAEVLASLNHPHIAQIHGIEDSGGVRALVMELVEGEDLSQRIGRGPIPLDEALPMARQIAEALEAAHEQGIIHRDLKPANIKVRPDGTVKVLDFGLAKLVEARGASEAGRADGGALSMSPTITSPAMHTGVGVLLGTAAYMAPEQAKGKPVDKRSDIWAFGGVLYEMLTGRRAFEGEDVSDTLANVLKGQPDWDTLPHETPTPIRRLLRRCLEKDRKRRLFDIGDARLEIEEALGGGSPDETASRVSASSRRGRERLLWASAVVVLALAAAGALVWARRPTPPTPEMRLEIATPPTADSLSLAISPDGQTIVFAATVDGQSRLWLRSLSSTSARRLENTDGGSFPFWSPDNRSIGFFANARLKRIDIDSGLVQELASAPEGRGGSWNREGTILFTPNIGGPIFRIPATGGNPVAVTRIEEDTRVVSHLSPHFLPDGRHFLYYALGNGSVVMGQLDSVETKRLLANVSAGAVYAASGYLLYSRQRALFAQRFDPMRLEVTGNPVPIAQQIAEGPNMAALSASAASVVAYRPGAAGGRRQLVWFDRSGEQLENVGQSGFLLQPSLSRDGRYVALRRDVEGTNNIWVLDTTSGAFRQFTAGQRRGGNGSLPIWSPDGSRIVFSGVGTGGTDLFLKPFTRAGREELLLATPENEAAMDWSPDGRFLLYRHVMPGTGNDLLAMSLNDRKSFPVALTNFDERDGQFSPDGKWVAFVSNESGRPEVYVQPFPGPGSKQSLSSNGGGQPRWRRDGKELFYIALDGQLMTVSIQSDPDGHTISGSAPTPLFLTNVGAAVQATNDRQQYVVSADGQRFLMNTIVEEAAAPITIILNWRPPNGQ